MAGQRLAADMHLHPFALERGDQFDIGVRNREFGTVGRLVEYERGRGCVNDDDQIARCRANAYRAQQIEVPRDLVGARVYRVGGSRGPGDVEVGARPDRTSTRLTYSHTCATRM